MLYGCIQLRCIGVSPSFLLYKSHPYNFPFFSLPLPPASPLIVHSKVFEPVAGNYYPVSVAAYLKDAYTETVLGVTTDRNQGAASLRNGHMEFMIQRRILADDARGVEEPLNETQSMTPWPEFKRIGEGITVTGSHWLTVSRTLRIETISSCTVHD